MALLRITRGGAAAAATVSNTDLLCRILCSSCSSHSPSTNNLSLYSDTRPPQPQISLSSPPSNPRLRQILDLILRTRRSSSNREEAAATLRSSGLDLDGDLAAAAIWELREDWESAFLAFQLSRLSRNPWSWHLIIQILSRNHKFSIAWLLLRKMHRLKILSPPPFIILMQEYAAANDPKKAVKTFRAMEKLGLAADLFSFHELLRSLCKHKNVEEAEEFFLSNSKIFPLTVEGFNIILEGWCRSMAETAEAKRWWREMAARCVLPDENSYAIMIECFAAEGNLFDSSRLYDEMKNRKKFVPSLRTYNSLIYCTARNNLIAEAKNLLIKVEETGSGISVESYNSLIRALCEGEKLEEARETVESMITKGINPNSETYRALAGAESMEGTVRLLQRMKEEGFLPDRSMFAMIMEKFFKRNQAENALRIMREMNNYGVERDEDHYMVVVRGLVDCGWMPKAMEFYGEMKGKGFRADPKMERVFKQVVAGGRGRSERWRAQRRVIGGNPNFRRD